VGKITALLIIIGIISFLILLLICPVSLTVDLNDQLKVIIRYLFVKINIKPKEQKNKKELKKSEEPKKKKRKNPFKEMVKEEGLSAAISKVCFLVKMTMDKQADLISHIIIRKFRLNISVGGNDPAITAMEYGAVCATVYPLRGLAASLMNFKENQVNIISDFNSEESKVIFHAKIQLRPIFILTAVISAAWQYLIYIIKEKNSKKKINL